VKKKNIGAVGARVVGTLDDKGLRTGRMVTLRDGAQVVTTKNRVHFFARREELEAFLGSTVRYPVAPGFTTDADKFLQGSFGLATAVRPSAKKKSTQPAKKVMVAPDPVLIGDAPLHIAAFIRTFDAQKHTSWKAVTDQYPKARLYGIECSPTSVAIDKDGKFSTRARLVIHVPFQRSDGTKSFGSRTVPAFVQGTLKDDGKIKISEFRLSVNHPG
jgi:hypothetical protein